LETESNIKHRKYKELAHMACLTNPISQPSLGVSPIWIPLISSEVSKICIVGGGVQTGSTRHVGHLLAYCTCPG
jgi:hypothetical protein